MPLYHWTSCFTMMVLSKQEKAQPIIRPGFQCFVNSKNEVAFSRRHLVLLGLHPEYHRVRHLNQMIHTV